MAVDSGLHADSAGVNVHTPFSYVYADSTARLAATGFVPGDVNKIALQVSDATVWLLTDDSPITWEKIGGGLYTDELAQDAVGGILDNASVGDVNFTYDDATPKVSGVVKKASADFSLTGDISPAQITSNQNDYNPTGLSTASTLRLSSDAARDITGLQGGADGRILSILNIGAQNITLKDESGSSTAGNRFALSADLTLAGDEGVLLQYDSTSSRWRALARPASAGGVSDASDSDYYVRQAGVWTSLWNKVVDESGASFANFTAASGTWASDGTWIKQTDTANSHRRAKYNTKVLNSGIIFECNIQPRSTGTDKLGGLVIGFDGSGNSGIRVHIKCGQSVWAVQEDGVSEITTFTAGATVNTTYNMRIVVFGGAVTVYQDGSIIGSARVAKSLSASFIGLASYGAEYWWKDIKAWVLRLPA